MQGTGPKAVLGPASSARLASSGSARERGGHDRALKRRRLASLVASALPCDTGFNRCVAGNTCQVVGPPSVLCRPALALHCSDGRALLKRPHAMREGVRTE